MTVEIFFGQGIALRICPTRSCGSYLSWFELDDPWMCYQMVVEFPKVYLTSYLVNNFSTQS